MNTPMPTAGAVLLTHLGVIRARGTDATKFLQSQLTNDVAAMDEAEVRLAGFCSAKGRLQATFIVWKGGPDDFRLVCSAGLLPSTLKRLSMFVLRAQCKLSDATPETPLRGLIGETARHAMGDMKPWTRRDAGNDVMLRLPDAAGVARCIVTAPLDVPSSPGAPSWPDQPAVSLDHWRWLEVQSGIPMIDPATVDQFVPQMLNFELLGGVDFQKGCYPGQEVVARSQYRGTIKRRMSLFDSPAPTAAGDEVFHSDDPRQPAGMVVNAAPGPSGVWSALVEVKLTALDGGTLHLRSADGPVLQARALPYALA